MRVFSACLKKLDADSEGTGVVRPTLQNRRGQMMKIILIKCGLFLMLTFLAVPQTVHAVDSPAKADAGQQMKTIIVDNYHPYTFKNDKGEPDGFCVDIAKAVAKAMGFTLEIRVDTWPNSKKALENGEIELLTMMAISPERDEYYDFSVPYITAYDAIFFKKDRPGFNSLKELSGKTVLVPNKDAAHDYLVSSGWAKTMRLKPVESLPEALRQLEAGQGDAAIMPKIVGIMTAKRLGMTDFEQSPPLESYSRPFSFAVLEGNQLMIDRLNQGLNIIKTTGEYKKIYQQWFGGLEEGRVNWQAIWKIGGMAALLMLVIVIWNVALKRQVARKTRELDQTNEDLQESAEDLKESQRIAHVGSWRLDLASNQVVWSDELYRMYGFDPTLPPPPYTEHQKLFTPESWDSLSTALNNTADTGVPYELELETVREDGTNGWMWVRGKAIQDEKGIIAGLRGAARDITDRKQVEKVQIFLAQTSSGTSGKLFFDKLARYLAQTLNMDFICIDRLEGTGLTARTVSVWCDGHFEDNVTYALKDTPCGDVVGKTVCCFPASVCQFFPKDQVLQDLRAESYVGVTLFNHMVQPIGLIAVIGRKPLSNRLLAENILKLVAVRAAGEMERLDAEIALRESEKQKVRLENQLQQAQKMESIGTLAGGIAHDFNNILYPIVGHTEMLMEDLSEENSSIRNSLNEIYTSSLRARDLVQQILAFARQEKNELKLMKMQPIIKEAMKLIRSTIPATITITQNLQPDCGPVNADPTQIHQIVMNLATNAYHAMEENGGELNVTLKEIELSEDDLIYPDMSPGLYACLTIGDTGVGINKDVMDRIFDPFFTTKEKGKGTGMGLSVVHGIVKRMNGEIQVYSEPGKGTEFHIYLPVVKSASESQESKTDEAVLGGCERILLVDDEQVIITMERLALERLGYQVTSRTSSIEALEAFKADPDKFDMVITDMSMPKMSGDKLAVELIKIRPDIPILLCTGYSESMTDEKIKSLGIKGFLMKPIVIKGLAKKIREVLDHGRK